MRLKRLWIDGFKNLNDFELDFTDKDGITVLVGNNGSGKSNVLEAISRIFKSLYMIAEYTERASFDFELSYEITLNDVAHQIEITFISNRFTFTSSEDNRINQGEYVEYLPSQIIANYSGEELRLWKDYYEDFYSKYNADIRTTNINIETKQKMLFINKYYWNIALLTLIASEVDISDIINDQLNKIKFTFNLSNITTFQTNEITNFVSNLYSEFDDGEFTLTEFQDIGIETHNRLFGILQVAHLPKNIEDRLINDIELIFQSGLTTNDFSEGMKKRILLKVVLNLLSDDRTLILLDEPDSHIHVANKGQLKELLCESSGIETILTTHSPTLMNKFDKHLVYLSDGLVDGIEKAEILKEISGDSMSLAEQQIVLNSNSDILLVEGKLDIIFIEEALKRLDGYDVLRNIVFIPTGGATGLRLFIDKFTAKDNQNIIAILDNDKAGKDEVKEVLTEEYRTILSSNGYVKINELKNTYLLLLPKPTNITNSQYEIEDYFPLDKLIEISKIQIDTFKVLKDFVLGKKFVKRKLSEECKEDTYSVEDFNEFKKLFDLIVTIKNSE